MSIKRKYYEIVTNKAEPKTVDILIFGVIGDDWFEESITAKQFVQDFSDLEDKYDRINIKINSPGGSVWDGHAIYNKIRASKKDTHTYNEGAALSMGFVILQAGKTRHTAKNALAMAHSSQGRANGNAQDMREAAEFFDKIDDTLAISLSDITGEKPEIIKSKFMDYKDHYFTAQEMLDNKFVDVIEEYNSDKIPSNIQSLSPAAIFDYYQNNSNWYKKLFESASNLFNQNKTEMNKAQAIALLNSKAQLSDEQIAQVIALINSDVTPEDHTKVTAELTTAKADLKTAQDALAPVKKLVEDIRLAMGGKATDTTDLLAICKEQKEKADKSTNNPSGKKKEDGDDFDEGTENSWDDAPWNKAVRAGYKKPEKK